MLKKLIAIFIMITMLMSVSLGASVSASFSISASSAVLIDANTREIIYQKDAYAQKSMASTTKIMTAIIALESGRLKEKVKITKEMVAVEGTSLGLLPGDKINLYDLVTGMMLTSGNDSANSIAIFLAGSLESFADIMNKKAKDLGMKNTHFVTPSGLDAKNHYTTAYDMAIMTAYALKNKDFSEIVKSQSAEIMLGNPMQKRYVYNHNRLLKSYEGAIGVKTGFTKKSGRCLVSAANRDGATIIAVTLNAPNDWQDHKELLDLGFEKTEKIDLSKNFNPVYAKIVGGKSSKIDTYTDDAKLNFSGDFDKSKLSRKIYLRRFYYAKINKGDLLGKVSYFYDEKEILTVNIYSAKSVEILRDKK
jgi:D-alanyl-D-alanine carboxypeptidase/D-alanyl-D-alanine carboxypeptidase (penicillin-binding protein 5/6)